MRQFNSARTITALITLAASPAIAEKTPGFYFGAGAGYTSGGELYLEPILGREEPLAAFGGFNFSSHFNMEGFYANINSLALLADSDSNLYTRSFLGTGLQDNSTSTVAGVSVVSSLVDEGAFRPFARVGLHHYDLQGNGGQSWQGDSLLFGAGADLDLLKGWNARLEWEHYNAADGQDRDIFSARFQYRF